MQIGDAEARGAQAAFSGVTWFGESAAVGQLGLVGTDGRNAYRIDNKIPFFSRDQMSGIPDSFTADQYSLISSGTIYEDDQFWWPYRDINNNTATYNSNVLAHNFVESSWSVYDLELHRIGKFQESDSIPWDDVDEDLGPEYVAWDTTYIRWDDFQSQKFVFFNVLGDANGFLYEFDDNVDQSAKITGITQASAAVVSSEPDVFKEGDKVEINNVSGMTEINGGIYEVTSVSGNQITVGIDSTDFTAYSSGGTITKQIKRELISKPFNPYVDQNKQCRLKKVHFYIDTNATTMLLDVKADKRTTSYRVNIPIDDGTDEGGATKKWTSITINQIARFHTLRLHQEEGLANEGLHAIILETEPTGRLER